MQRIRPSRSVGHQLKMLEVAPRWQLLVLLALVALLRPGAAWEASVPTSVTQMRLLGLGAPIELEVRSVALVAAVLLSFGAAWACACRSEARDCNAEGSAQTPERLKVFTQWAQQQIEHGRPESHRQILDDVIATFATYAQRIDQGASRSVQDAAEDRLRVLIQFLETPKVNEVFRSVNWDWLREWDQQQLEPRDARQRCTVVFPTICTSERLRAAGGGASASSPQSMAYLAAWCTDFLSRRDVRDFLGIVDAPAFDRQEISPLDSVNFLTPGALYSESSSDDEEEHAPCRQLSIRSSGDWHGQGSGDTLDFLKREFEGQEHVWDCADATTVLVRGANYLFDRKKIRSKSMMLDLVEVDLVKTWEEMQHYSINPRGKVVGLREGGDSRFYFIINFRLIPIQFAQIYAVPKDADWWGTPEGRVFKKFIEGSDEERGKRLKVVCRVIEGPWLVKKGAPEKPGIIGRKLTIDWFKSENHLEASINCISSNTGRQLVSLFTGAARHFSMELFFILEGQAPEELPERILGGFSFFHGNLGILPLR